MDRELQWLGYADAAKRVKRSARTIRRWRSEGMPMITRDGERFVHIDVLTAWLRQSLINSPVHQYRMRRKRLEAGFPATPDPLTPSQGTGAPRPTPDAGTAQIAVPVLPVVNLDGTLLRVGGAEYTDLIDAMKRDTPPCSGIDSFTADKIDQETVPVMVSICGRCPMVTACRTFAETTRPDAGFWAGERWVRGKRAPRTENQDAA